MLNRFINGLVDIIFPNVCLSCKGKLCMSTEKLSANAERAEPVSNLICMQCWSKIKRNLPPFCHSCGRHLEANNSTKNVCPGCIRRTVYFDRAFSPCVYEGIIKELIHKFKYNGKDNLGFTLSRLMIEFIREYNLPMDCIDFIVPIPLHKTRLREREFNQAEILSKYIGREFKKDMLIDVLGRPRPTKTQTDLESDVRLLNVKGSFAVNKQRDIKGKNILLVDDVLTTGATSSEAAYTLKKAGAGIVFVLTLAN